MAQSAGYQRLVVVTLHRDHRYGGVEEVKEEIASRALELAQDGLPQLKKVRMRGREVAPGHWCVGVIVVT